jgi:hypothetical protein
MAARIFGGKDIDMLKSAHAQRQLTDTATT